MTISTEVRKAGPFIGNGSASVFPFAFKVFKAADLIVVRRQDNIDEETTLVLDSDYHVTLNGNQDTTPGGVVTLVGGALASGFTLVVSSELPYLQPTDLTNQGGFYPKVITNALDRLTIFCQQLAEITGRTLKLPITAPTNISAEIPLPNPSELIAWNETGTGLTTVSPQSLVTSIAYGSATADLFAGDGVTTTFPLSTNPASVNNLDVSIDGHSQRPVQGGIGDYSWNGGASITFAEPPPAPSIPGDKNVLVRYMQAIPVSDSGALHAQTREALRRSYAEAGYNLADGSFETGGTLASTSDVLLLESEGTAYAWTGVYPVGGYVVAPGADPTLPGSGYVPRTDVVLRDQIGVIAKRFDGVSDLSSDASLPIGSRVSTGLTEWEVTASVTPLAYGTNYLLPVTDVHFMDWGVAVDGSQLADDDLTQAIACADFSGVWCVIPNGSILIREVPHGADSRIKGAAHRGTNLLIDDNVPDNRGLYYERATVAECGVELENITFKAKSTGIGYGWTMKRVAFAKSKNIRFVNLARGENFFDVLISRFVEHYYKSCVVGGYNYGDAGANINIYVHPLSRNCTDTYVIEGNPSNDNAAYGTKWIDGDFEYNQRVFNITARGQSAHIAENCTFEGNSTATITKNELRVMSGATLDIVNPKLGDISSSPSPALLTSDSTGTLNLKGPIGKQTSAFRVRVPVAGRYDGGNELRDGNLSNLPSNTADVVLHNRVHSSFCSVAKSSIAGFIAGVVSAGVKRVSSFDSTSGWSSGAGTLVSDPVGGNTAFEVTTQARMACNIPTTGKSVVQFWAQCLRGDSGTVDVTILRSTGLTAISVISLNYNGVSDWKLFHAVIDASALSGFDGGVTLVFSAVPGIRYWGQQVASNTSAPVPRIPSGVEYPSGGVVIDNQCATHMGQHYEAKRESNSVGTVLATQSLVSSTDQSGAKSYEVAVITSFGGTSITEVYHVTLAYGLAVTVADCVKLISTSTAGATSAQRVSVGVSSLTANSAKSLTFTVNVFVNTLQVKVRPLW